MPSFAGRSHELIRCCTSMQAAIRHSEWDEVRVRHRVDSIRYVYRRAPGASQFEPWVVVAPSAIMQRVGQHGLGLYAARTFQRGDYVGQYPRNEVARYPTRAAALAAPETRRLVRRGHDKLIVVRASQGPGFVLLDGEGGGPPHVELCNDPQGTALQPNAVLTDSGWLRIVQARVPAFDLSRSVAQNATSELRIDYGDEYWALQSELGRSATQAIEVD